MSEEVTPKKVVVEKPVLRFTEAYTRFSAVLKSSFEESNADELEHTSNKLVTSDNDNKKLTLDQCFREYLISELDASNPALDLQKGNKFVQFAIQAAQKEICNPTTPIQVLADLFDTLPLSSCEILFKTVEREVSTWRSPIFYHPIRNSLLRICNDLLRRLSRTQNTVFCGRILLFLAKFFPFSERSGLNVISEFNLDNVTSYSKVPLVRTSSAVENGGASNISDPSAEAKQGEGDSSDGDKATKENGKEENGEVKGEKEKDEEKKDEAEAMEVELIVEVPEKEKLEVEKKKDGEEEDTTERINREFKLYSKFWQLQDFFRSPTQCYQKDLWELFCAHTSDILVTFSKRKLDTRASKKEELVRGDAASSFIDQYFAKYLTNQNLLSLQLNDSNFRRYVLLQYLIIFQYLQTSVKFKTETQVLSTDQTKWIDENRKKIFKLLDETPPNGKAFSASVKSILKRELIWIRWKNEGCKSFVIKKKKVEVEPEEGKQTDKLRKRKAPLGELMKREAKAGRINLGNKGLTKLWNINTDNFEACKEQERNFLPSLEAFFEDAILEIDPKNKIEESYKKVNNGEWGWRALRLMSRRSQHFFLLGNCQISKLPDYLEMMMGKMAADLGKPVSIGAPETKEVKETNDEVSSNGAGDANGSTEPEGKLTDEQIASLAVRLAAHWTVIVPKLGLSSEKVEECKAGEVEHEVCLKLLSAWVDQEGEGASVEEISYILSGAKLSHLIEGLF